ncbi:type II secretion system protein GspI [Motiliproteus sp. MSK22-1]|nr:type II secretion system protein GspI [Motiliproteus sp. MSK22-1]
MVAVFIFALATAGFFQVLGQSARHADYLETKYFAELLAHNDLVELSLVRPPPETGLSNGKHILAERTFYWFQAVNETENSTIRKVNLRIETEQGQVLSELNLFVGINP